MSGRCQSREGRVKRAEQPRACPSRSCAVQQEDLVLVLIRATGGPWRVLNTGVMIECSLYFSRIPVITYGRIIVWEQGI